MNASLDAIEQRLQRSRLVVIVRLVDHTNVVDIVTTLCDAGVTFLEVTVERPEGLDSLRRAIEAVGDRATVGAGTVLSVQTVQRVAELGAQFIVTPNTDVAVINASHELGLLAIPGAFTATEVVAAVSAGSRFVKLFPAGDDVTYLRALRGPLPYVKFIPTGGVTIENAVRWLNAGATAVAMGSNLVPGSGETKGLFERAQRAVAVTKDFRE